MLSVLTCIAFEHDLRLVVVAAVICATACAAAFGAHIRATKSGGIMRWAWAGLTGLVAGAGVWATHFIAMLAYLPDVPAGYAIPHTALSLGIAIVGMGAGFLVPVLARGAAAAILGGALTGFAVAAMHFVGIAGFRAQARIEWDMAHVIAAIVIGVVGGAGAFYLRHRLRGRAGWLGPAGALVLAIVGLHFTAMAAVQLTPDPTLAVPKEFVGRNTLALATAVMVALILGVASSLTWMERMGQRATLQSLRHAINAVPAGLAFFDPHGMVVAWNAAFAELMRICGVEMSRDVTRRQLLAATQAAGWYNQNDADARAQIGGSASGTAWEFRLEDGRWLSYAAFRTDDGGGAVVLTDISEQRKIAETLSAARDAAEAANAAKTAFLANMSHEIRTPLNGMLGVAEVLGRTKLNEKQRELVGVMQDSGGHLNRLLADLLDLARIEAGALELRPEPADVGELVESMRSIFAARADEKGLSLRVELGRQAGDWVECDPLRLRQVIANLVSNAIKFTEAGQVTIAVERHGERLTFEVRDTGPGFDEAAKATIFGRFQQADETSTRRHGGAGLGLALSQEYVRLMGGELTCSSLPGVGSVFAFDIDATVLAREAAAEPVAEIAEAQGSGRFRVLIVDDNQVNRQVLGLILDAAAIEHAEAEDGQVGLDMVTTGGFDAVLMDLQMPVMDGFEAMRRIRAWEGETGRRRMPIFVVSANCLQEHVDAGMAAGADGHLNKPVSVPQLLVALTPHAEAAQAGARAA